MTDLIDVVQLQETDDALIVLFDITLPNGTVVRLTDGLDQGDTNIYFPQKTAESDGTYPLHQYFAIPIAMDGISQDMQGPMSRPTLTIANIPSLTRSISSNSDGTDDEKLLREILDAESIDANKDLIDTKVVCRKTLLSYTYTSSDSDPSSAPVEFPTETYIIERVSGENELLVSFELASPIDIEGVLVPGRIVVGKYCPWMYQGFRSKGDGGCDWPLDSDGRFYDVNDDVITKDISTIAAYSSSTLYSAGDKVKTTSASHTKIWEARKSVPANRDPNTNGAFWTRLDVCSKTLRGCKVRFQGNSTDDTLDTSNALPFGGFPGTKKFK